MLEVEGVPSPATICVEEFYNDVQNGLVQEAEPSTILVNHSELVTEDDRLLAQKYDDYITPLLSEENPCSRETLKQVIDTVAARRGDIDKNKPSTSTLYNWYKKFQSPEVNRNFAALVNPCRKKRGRQASAWVQDLFHDVVDEYYLKPIGDGALSAKETFDKFDRAFQHELLKLPDEDRQSVKGICRSVCYEMLNNYDPVDVCIAREGYSVAVKRYRNSTEHFVAERPLELVQIDAVHLNLALRDDDGNYIGLVVVFFAIDICTRAILSYVISVAKKRREDLSSAIDLIKSGIRPKAKPGHTRNEWPLYGIPNQIQHDSGIFSSNHFKAFLQEAAVHTYQNPAGRSWFNALIERFHRTFRDKCCSKIPGYVGRRKDEIKDSVDIKATPYTTPDQLQRLVEAYILDDYHQKPHKGLGGETPQQACNRLEGFLCPPPPATIQKLENFRGVLCKATIQAHKGIQRDGLFYNDSQGQLLKLWEKLGGPKSQKNPEVQFYRSELDISVISVVDPVTRTRFPVSCTSVKTKTSLAEHKAKQAAKKRGTVHTADLPQTMAPILEEIKEYKAQKQSESEKNSQKRKQARHSVQQSIETPSPKTPEELNSIIEENTAGINNPPEMVEQTSSFDNTPQHSRKRSKKAIISKFEV
ncbi:transposase [Alteromonas pelagimontana]|uniref:Transposase n=1 Tax=Alteromonas pelagimontana TaxID=1858656 RepID=A0A6M4MCX4_9ALTE|nr:DDE-type integrase/transposase/recombinase [Alteromonas pelagimontana]QJR80877.1 transposase [Alteromonas pelagimontana]